MTSRWT